MPAFGNYYRVHTKCIKAHSEIKFTKSENIMFTPQNVSQAISIYKYAMY